MLTPRHGIAGSAASGDASEALASIDFATVVLLFSMMLIAAHSASAASSTGSWKRHRAAAAGALSAGGRPRIECGQHGDDHRQSAAHAERIALLMVLGGFLA